MIKDYRSYALLELFDVAKTQAFILDDSITEKEADKLADQLDKEYIKTILRAFGNEFESAKASIDLTRATIQNEELADKVAVHKLYRGNFAYKDKLIEFVSVPEIAEYFASGKVYHDARTAIDEIYDYANLIVDTCYSVRAENGFLERDENSSAGLGLEFNFDSEEYLLDRMGRDLELAGGEF